MAKIIRMLIILVLIAIIGIAGFLIFQFLNKPALIVDVGEFNGKQISCEDSDGINLNKRGFLKLIDEDGVELELLGDEGHPSFVNSLNKAYDYCIEGGVIETTCQTDGSFWREDFFECTVDCENGRCV